MQLPTDSLRKTNEVFKTGEVIGIRVTSGIIEVQCEFEDDAKTPWMPYALPFVGGTSIFCYPRIGQGGRVMSEGGENNINVFIPSLDTSQQFAGLGEFDFKILFHNGDFIHHSNNNLHINVSNETVINSKAKTVVNSKEIITNSDRITLNASTEARIKAPIITLNGNVFINGGISAGSGMGRSSLRAVFNYPVDFMQPAYAKAELYVNGKAVSTHVHPHSAGSGETGVMK